jgi:hypothetical protein
MKSIFSAHIVWRMANKFGKKCANLSLKFGVLIVCEIERLFFAKCCVPEAIAWQKSLVKSTGH